eukprot:Skav222294  [mRNA]  locus=scaffold3734:74980:75279:- [translate_table: standard]
MDLRRLLTNAQKTARGHVEWALVLLGQVGRNDVQQPGPDVVRRSPARVAHALMLAPIMVSTAWKVAAGMAMEPPRRGDQVVVGAWECHRASFSTVEARV